MASPNRKIGPPANAEARGASRHRARQDPYEISVVANTCHGGACTPGAKARAGWAARAGRCTTGICTVLAT